MDTKDGEREQNNVPGTVNSASLTVDFFKQTISNFNLQVTVPPTATSGNRVWVASSTDIAAADRPV